MYCSVESIFCDISVRRTHNTMPGNRKVSRNGKYCVSNNGPKKREKVINVVLKAALLYLF